MKNAPINDKMVNDQIVNDFGHYQFLKQGYFVVDPDTTAEHLVFNRTASLKDNWKK
jgi:translation elongation factor EF-Ts